MKYNALLDGLEIRENFLKKVFENKDFRFDSQFYTQEPKKNLLLVYDKIGNKLIKSQYGISISMNEDDIGYPIYRMNEIHNMLCDLEVDKYADISQEELKTFKLNDRDVLFNRTNSFEWVGRTGLYKKTEKKDYVFASYLVRFIPDEEYILPEYLATFLNSKQGVWDIKRRARQSINQTNVNPEEIKEIDIPLLSMRIQQKIKFIFDVSHEKRVVSDSLYKEAEELLLKELDLLDFKPSDENIAKKSFNESFGISGRLDSEYYQPKYDEIIEKIKSYKGGFESLAYFAKNYSTGYTFSSESYVENGTYLIRINNIKNGYLDIDNAIKIPNTDKELSQKDIAKENDILISMSGTIGNSSKIPKGIEAVINQRIMRITSQNIGYEILPMIINSIIGQYQLERIGTGGVQINISGSDILNILIPCIENLIQTQIEEKIKKSFEFKEQSKKLLDLAKRAVEVAIEQNEDEALKLLEDINA